MKATEQLDSCLLERKDDTITLWVGFFGHADFAVDHGHDAIAELWGHSVSFTYIRICARHHCKYLLVNDRLDMLCMSINVGRVKAIAYLDGMTIDQNTLHPS